jgi:hypothetical protein
MDAHIMMRMMKNQSPPSDCTVLLGSATGSGLVGVFILSASSPYPYIVAESLF